MRRLFLPIVILLSSSGFASLLFFAFFSSNSEIERRVRSYFKIPQFSQVTPDIIRSSIYGELPVGSSVEKIYSFLNQANLGTDRFSVCSQLTLELYKSRDIVCSINLNTDMTSLEFRKIFYEIRFEINESRKLKNIEVRENVITL